MRMSLLTILILQIVFSIHISLADETSKSAFTEPPRIKIFNPTDWKGPMIVEIPVGSFCPPESIDWDNVVLKSGDKKISFSIREGRPHYKSNLMAPVRNPRAEDLVVFCCDFKPDTWTQLDILPHENLSDKSVLKKKQGKLWVSYPDITVIVNEETGLIEQVRAFDQDLLENPLRAEFFELEKGAMDSIENIFTGNWTHGYKIPTVKLNKKARLGGGSVQLISSSSTSAMTELNFMLKSKDGLAVALTYRIHSGGLLEICSDERPWQGRSPWYNHALEYSLNLAGEKQTLPYLENRWPFYGFKYHFAAVKYPAIVHCASKVGVLELGEETINGRRWNRRLYVMRQEDLTRYSEMVELADEGLVVKVEPMRIKLAPGDVGICYPKVADIPAQTLMAAMAKLGMKARFVSPEDDIGCAVVLQLLDNADREGIVGDGFIIKPRKEGVGITISSGTLFGLMQASVRIGDFLKDASTFPVFASNPMVHLRAGAFGGGYNETDFPYGDDAEWKHALDGMITSGMNSMTCMGMWSNWKMPISYKYMPELQSDDPKAYDEISGTRFSEFEHHNENGLRRLKYLHDRGVKVWLWQPLGCVPTTFAQKHPEAMNPNNLKAPCFTHPTYQRFIKVFLKELLECYSIDGIVFCRDDNGGICTCAKCQTYVSQSRTRDGIWEQYLIWYNLLKAHGFKGNIAAYPYCDPYQIKLEPLLPDDLLIIGHGSELGLLSRNFDNLAPMGDQWPDNLFAFFRLAPAPRMKRMLADRPSFWAGGAYIGVELLWESIGAFGWEPTRSVNSLRYQLGTRMFGENAALKYVSFSNIYEHLWDIYALWLQPGLWIQQTLQQKNEVVTDIRKSLCELEIRCTALETAATGQEHSQWFAQVKLFKLFLENQINHLELADQMHELVQANCSILDKKESMPESVRQKIVMLYKKMFESADSFVHAADTVPGNMIANSKNSSRPWQEWGMGPYHLDLYLPQLLKVPQFSGRVEIFTPQELCSGEPFNLRLKLSHKGVYPWIPDLGPNPKITLSGIAEELSLPHEWIFNGPWMVFGDTREITLQGTVPKESGSGKLTVILTMPKLSPWHDGGPMTQEVPISWKRNVMSDNQD